MIAKTTREIAHEVVLIHDRCHRDHKEWRISVFGRWLETQYWELGWAERDAYDLRKKIEELLREVSDYGKPRTQ